MCSCHAVRYGSLSVPLQDVLHCKTGQGNARWGRAMHGRAGQCAAGLGNLQQGRAVQVATPQNSALICCAEQLTWIVM